MNNISNSKLLDTMSEIYDQNAIKMFIPLDEYYFEVGKNITTRVNYMSPLEYMSKVVLGFGSTVNEILETVDKTIVKQYAANMLKGDLFQPISLSYTTELGFTQEGRHRAMAVQHLIDIKAIPEDTLIPVVIVTEV